MTSAENSCSVCAGPFEPHTEASCNSCGLAYHLNQRQDLTGQDCGEVWINEEHLGLEFACNTCLHPPDSAALDEVLTLAEAAALAGMAEGALEHAAGSGAVRNRRTAAGVYLFQRRDILDYAGRLE